MLRRGSRHHHRVGAGQLAIAAVLAGLTIYTAAGCGGGGGSGGAGSNLYRAAKSGSYKAADRYLDQGEDINAARAEDGRTPLHAAADRGHRRVVILLLNRGASANARDNEGDTALHLAAMGGHDSIVRVLLAEGADPTIRNNAGQTPRDLAKDRIEVSRALRRAGG